MVSFFLWGSWWHIGTCHPSLLKPQCLFGFWSILRTHWYFAFCTRYLRTGRWCGFYRSYTIRYSSNCQTDQAWVLSKISFHKIWDQFWPVGHIARKAAAFDIDLYCHGFPYIAFGTIGDFVPHFGFQQIHFVFVTINRLTQKESPQVSAFSYSKLACKI